MRSSKHVVTGRKGTVAPLLLLLLVALVGVLAFAIDIGWIALAKANLHAAADAAALAGAGQLMEGYIQYNQSGQKNQSTILSTSKAAAIAAAKKYAAYNYAGGVSALELNDSDIEFGFTDSSNVYTAEPQFTGYPNTVKVTMRLDTTANGSLSLIFARIFGKSSTDVVVSAAATIYTVEVDGLQGVAPAFPITYDYNHWNNFLSTGLDPDGNASFDSDGNPALEVYPSTKYKGNFGILSLDGQNAGASTLSNWVDNGISESDIQSLQNKDLIPLSEHDSNTWDWLGESGMKTSLIHSIEDHLGETAIMPLYKPVNSSAKNYTPGQGRGGKYYYNVVKFIAVKVIKADHEVVVVPSPLVVDDSNFTLVNPNPAGPASGGDLLTTFLPPKLTQ